MNAAPTRLPPRDERQRHRAGMLLQRAIDERYLPPFLPGEPSGLAAGLVTGDLVEAYLRELEALYGVRRWSRASYLRAHVRGALEGWRPGQRVGESKTEIRVVSTSCPVAAEAEIDPRTCQMCRAFNREVALRTVPEATDVWFDDRITKGDSQCVMTVRMEPQGAERA